MKALEPGVGGVPEGEGLVEPVEAVGWEEGDGGGEVCQVFGALAFGFVEQLDFGGEERDAGLCEEAELGERAADAWIATEKPVGVGVVGAECVSGVGGVRGVGCG